MKGQSPASGTQEDFATPRWRAAMADRRGRGPRIRRTVGRTQPQDHGLAALIEELRRQAGVSGALIAQRSTGL